MKQGVKNIARNRMFSIASIATMAACIFLFGIFYSIITNFNYIVENFIPNVDLYKKQDEILNKFIKDLNKLSNENR